MQNSKRYKVIVDRQVTELLQSHVRFLAQVSPEAADDLIDDVMAAINSLEIMPERCSWLNDEMLPANKYRKRIFSKRYALIFLIKENTVYVDYILDCRQEYPWLL